VQDVAGNLLYAGIGIAKVQPGRVGKPGWCRKHHVPPAGSGVENKVAFGSVVNGGGVSARYLALAGYGTGCHHGQGFVAANGWALKLPADQRLDPFTLLHRCLGKYPMVRKRANPVGRTHAVRFRTHEFLLVGKATDSPKDPIGSPIRGWI